MKKIAALLVLLALSITAQASSTFFGFGFASNKLKAEVYDDYTSETYSGSTKDTAFAFKLGKMRDKNRTYAEFNRTGFDGGDLTSILVRHDFLFPVQDQLFFFVGGHGGVGILADDEDTLYGAQYGVQVGAVFNISDQAFIDFGYSYSLTNISDEYSYTACNGYTYSYYSGLRCSGYTSYTDTVELDSVSGLNMSVNMRF